MDPKKEQAYADEIPDEEQETPTYEQTYRDGSLQNECWSGDGYGNGYEGYDQTSRYD